MKIKLTFLSLFFLLAFNCLGQEYLKENTFNFKLKGTGNPVVIFESGLGETLKGWSQIQDSISQITTTLSYDRLGLGNSAKTEKARTMENIASELHSILKENKIDGPYILVGHSLGGFIIRKFQNSYPEEVLGLVMVDPSIEDQMEKLFGSLPKEQEDVMRKGLKDFYASKPIGIQNEFKEVFSAEEEIKTIQLPNKIPITILASFKPQPPFGPEAIKIKSEIINNLIKHAPQTKLISTTKSGHYIHYSEPTIVIDAIIEMIENVKRK